MLPAGPTPTSRRVPTCRHGRFVIVSGVRPERAARELRLVAGDAAYHHLDTPRRNHGRARGTTRRTLGGRAASVLAKPGDHAGCQLDPGRPRRGDVHRYGREGAWWPDHRGERRRSMEHMKIPGTDLSPSRIGLGTWAMG